MGLGSYATLCDSKINTGPTTSLYGNTGGDCLQTAVVEVRGLKAPGAINWNATVDGVTFHPVQATDLSLNTASISAYKDGLYQIDMRGILAAKADLLVTSPTPVTITAKGYQAD